MEHRTRRLALRAGVDGRHWSGHDVAGYDLATLGAAAAAGSIIAAGRSTSTAGHLRPPELATDIAPRSGSNLSCGKASSEELPAAAAGRKR